MFKLLIYYLIMNGGDKCQNMYKMSKFLITYSNADC